MESTKTIEIPNYREESQGFRYYILTKGIPAYYEEDYINVPGFTNTVSKIIIVACWTDKLLTYFNNNNELLTIPDHDIVLGYPIFTSDKDCYFDETDEDEVYIGWKCPQNFFLTRSSAEQVLELLKKKYGTVKASDVDVQKMYHVMNPIGHFNFN